MTISLLKPEQHNRRKYATALLCLMDFTLCCVVGRRRKLMSPRQGLVDTILRHIQLRCFFLPVLKVCCVRRGFKIWHSAYALRHKA